MRNRVTRPGGPYGVRAAIIGVKVRAVQSEKIVEKTTVRAKSLRNCPAIPCVNATGMKTPRFVDVVDRTEIAISAVPFSAASTGPYPISR